MGFEEVARRRRATEDDSMAQEDKGGDGEPAKTFCSDLSLQKTIHPNGTKASLTPLLPVVD